MKFTKRFQLAAMILIALIALLFFSSAPPLPAQSALSGFTDGLTGLPYTRTDNITNTTTSRVGFHTTNTLIAITNGTTTVTNQWIPLRGFGARVWFVFSPTNTTVTNVFVSLRTSPDGTNASNYLIPWTIGSVAGGTGKFCYDTNLTQAVLGNAKFLQVYQIILTNGVNDIGTIFCTNNGPTLAFQTFY